MATISDLLAALRRFGLEDGRFDAMIARRLDAPPAEFKAMDHLHQAGALTPGELGDRLALTSGAVTALVDRLERLGWAEREPHPTDRRSTVVRKSPTSDEVVGPIYGPFAADIAKAARRLSSAEREAAIGFLEQAAEVARRHADLHRDAGRLFTGSAHSPPPPQ